MRAPGEVARYGECQERTTYAELESQYTFVPFVVETSGVWGSEAIKFTARLGELMWKNTGEPNGGAFFKERISLEIQRGSARSLLETMEAVGIGAGH